jgi:hypothetical protein
VEGFHNLTILRDTAALSRHAAIRGRLDLLDPKIYKVYTYDVDVLFLHHGQQFVWDAERQQQTLPSMAFALKQHVMSS